jgi:hypothetical protein
MAKYANWSKQGIAQAQQITVDLPQEGKRIPTVRFVGILYHRATRLSN